jgi:MFS family permease
MDLPAGRVADGLPPGRALAGSGLGVAISAAILATAETLAQALAGMFFLGAASALTNTTGMTLFATSAPAARRGAAMAAFSMALMTGQTLGPGVGGIVAGLGGWRLAQAVAAGIGVAVMVVCLLAPAGRRHARESRPETHDAGGLTRVQAAALAAVPFAVFFTMGALPQTLIPVIGSDELSLSASAIGLALAIGGAARFAGSAAAGAVSDRISRKAALIPSLLLMAGAVAILAAPPTLTTWLLAIVLLSAASSGIAVAATIIADNVPAATVGRRLGTFRFTGDFGLLAGPAITGLLYAGAGRAPAMLVTAAVLGATALAALLIVPGARA